MKQTGTKNARVSEIRQCGPSQGYKYCAVTTNIVKDDATKDGFTCHTPTVHHSCPMSWCRNACMPGQTPRPLWHGRCWPRATRSCRTTPDKNGSSTSMPCRRFLRRTCVQSRQLPKKHSIRNGSGAQKHQSGKFKSTKCKPHKNNSLFVA